MTLLVAGISGENIWMVSDTLISGGALGTREREYVPKIEVALDKCALIGFAGDHHHGTRIIRSAASMRSGREVLDYLVKEHQTYPSVDLAYGYKDPLGFHLFQISNRCAFEKSNLFIGNHAAFEVFQRLRHGQVDHVPKAMKHFVMTSSIEALSKATIAMTDLMSVYEGRDVGGWAAPYALGADGARLCKYTFSTSDPIFEMLDYGSVVPHGTAEAGGYSISFSDFADEQGMVVYWPQSQHGKVFVRGEKNIEIYEFTGPPSVFKNAVEARLGKSVHVWVGDASMGTVTRISIVRDDSGVPCFAVVTDGKSYSIAALNLETPFYAKANVNLGPEIEAEGRELENLRFEVSLSEDRLNVNLRLNVGQAPANQSFDANQVDALIEHLGRVRASMEMPVRGEPRRESGHEEVMCVDPAWTTEYSPVSTVPGIVLRMRHVGFGWLTFLLPPHEVENLGQWLVNSAKKSSVQDVES